MSTHPLWLALNRKIGNLKSLDDSVCPCQDVRRNRQADLLGSFEIDDELELLRLLDRKVSRLSAFQNLIHVSGGTPVQVVTLAL